MNVIKALMEEFNVDEYREMIEKLHNWSYNQDFSGRNQYLINGKLFFKAYVVNTYWDTEYPISSITELRKYLIDEGEKFTKEDEDNIRASWKAIGLK